MHFTFADHFAASPSPSFTFQHNELPSFCHTDWCWKVHACILDWHDGKYEVDPVIYILLHSLINFSYIT